MAAEKKGVCTWRANPLRFTYLHNEGSAALKPLESALTQFARIILLESSITKKAGVEVVMDNHTIITQLRMVEKVCVGKRYKVPNQLGYTKRC